MTPATSLLRRRLGAIRVRLAVRRLIKGVSGSLLLAAGLYLALLLGSYLIPELMDVPLIGIATIVFTGGLAITISIQVLGPPSRLEAARRRIGCSALRKGSAPPQSSSRPVGSVLSS